MSVTPATILQIATTMMSLMNKSSDPCVDFYDYACGHYQYQTTIKEKGSTLRLDQTFDDVQKELKGVCFDL
jgi:hypothetical protein